MLQAAVRENIVHTLPATQVSVLRLQLHRTLFRLLCRQPGDVSTAAGLRRENWTQ
jgi:hypothetical protein